MFIKFEVDELTCLMVIPANMIAQCIKKNNVFFMDKAIKYVHVS